MATDHIELDLSEDEVQLPRRAAKQPVAPQPLEQPAPQPPRGQWLDLAELNAKLPNIHTVHPYSVVLALEDVIGEKRLGLMVIRQDDQFGLLEYKSQSEQSIAWCKDGPDEAVCAFCDRFEDYTLDSWESRMVAQPHPGKYSVLMLDGFTLHGEHPPPSSPRRELADAISRARVRIIEQSIGQRQECFPLIDFLDLDMHLMQLQANRIDAELLFLVNEEWMRSIWRTAARLSAVIDTRSRRETLAELSHHLLEKLRIKRVETIDSHIALKMYAKTIQLLQDAMCYREFTKSFCHLTSKGHTTTTFLQKIGVSFTTVIQASSDFAFVEDVYTRSGLGIHGLQSRLIKSVFTVEFPAKAAVFRQLGSFKRTFLWKAFPYIALSRFLAPAESSRAALNVIDGKNFGEVLFDSSSRALRNAQLSDSSEAMFLVLYEVAVGDMLAINAPFEVDITRVKEHTVKVEGKNMPQTETKDGVDFFIDHKLREDHKEFTLTTPQYHVLDSAQILPRYLLLLH